MLQTLNDLKYDFMTLYQQFPVLECTFVGMMMLGESYLDLHMEELHSVMIFVGINLFL